MAKQAAARIGRREVLAGVAAGAVAVGLPLAEAGAADASSRPHKLKVIVAGAHPDDPELHAHLARNAPAAGHREIPEMRRQLEIAPAGIPGKTLLQQRLQLPAQICADLDFRDTQYRDGLAVRARLVHTLESSAVLDDLLREPM